MSDEVNNEMKFTRLFRQLIIEITELEKAHIDKISSILNELAAMFRLSRSEVCIYRTPEDEKNGRGEIICTYDTGTQHELVIGLRAETSVMSITCVNLYMTPGTEPLSPDERNKAELVACR